MDRQMIKETRMNRSGPEADFIQLRQKAAPTLTAGSIIVTKKLCREKANIVAKHRRDFGPEAHLVFAITTRLDG